MGRIASLLGLFVSLALLVGCTRELDQTGKISLDLKQFQKIGASAIEERISFVAVNVTASDMPRKVFVFDAHDHCVGECETEPTVPSRVEFEVPPGPGRLIQVLLIMETLDTSTGSETEVFKYGEQKVGLNPGDNPVKIAVSAIAGSSNKEGSASGRYLFSDGSAFTGPVALEFTPPTGSPNMEIFQLEMFNGWFSIHLLDNVNLTYRMANGHVMFGGGVSQQSPVLNGSSSVVMKVNVPAHFEQRGDPNGVSFLEIEQARMFSLGFWKGGVPETGKTVCRDSAAYNSDNSFLDKAKTDPLSWPNDYVVSGGTSCAMPSSPVTLSQMAVDGKILDYGGGDSPLFRGPYVKFANADGYYSMMNVQFDIAANQVMTVSWKYLPGVVNSKVAGSTVFVKAFPGEAPNFEQGGSGLDCDRLKSEGFAAFPVNGSTQSVEIPLTALAGDGDGKAIVCPRKPDGTHFRTAIESHCLTCGGSDGGGTNGGSFEDLRITGQGVPPPETISVGTCLPLQVGHFKNGSVSAVDANLIVQLQLNGSGSSSFFGSAADCAAGTPPLATGQIMIPVGQSTADFWFKGLTNEYAFIDAFTTSGPPMGSGFLEVAVASGTPNQLAVHTTSLMALNGCYEVKVIIENVSSLPGDNTSGYVLDLLAESGLTGGFFSSGDCTGPLTQATFAVGESIKRVHFRPTSIVSNGQITATFNTGNPGIGIGNATVNVGLNTFDHFIIGSHSGLNEFLPGTCNGLFIESVNNVGASVATASAIPLSLSTSTNAGGGVSFFTSGDCSGSPVSNVTFPAGGGFVDVYFLANGLTDMVTVTANDGVTTPAVVELRPPNPPSGADETQGIPFNLGYYNLLEQPDANTFQGMFDSAILDCNNPMIARNVIMTNNVSTNNGSGSLSVSVLADTINFAGFTIFANGLNGQGAAGAAGGNGGLGASGGGGGGDQSGGSGGIGGSNGSTGTSGNGGSLAGLVPQLVNTCGFAFPNAGNGGAGGGGGTGGAGNIGIAGGGGGGNGGSVNEGAGGGGGGGGLIVIVANKIFGGGALDVSGGNGGPGIGTGSGGGGGGGGIVWIAARHYDGSLTVDVVAGNGGTGGISGVAGMPGMARIFQINPNGTLTERAFNQSW